MRIGILTGGGDCPGLNAVIRAVVRTALDHGGDHQVLGIRNGFSGLVTDSVVPLAAADVSGILPRGGTILGSSNRDNPFQWTGTLDGEKFEKADLGDRALATAHRHRLDALLVVGGDGTLSIAHRFLERGLPVIGVPKTIDNDLGATDQCFGYDTAVSVCTEAIDRIHTTAESHHRVMLVEVMGRHAGWIGLAAGLAGGGDVILLPEIPFSVERVVEAVEARSRRGKDFSIVVVAEGASPIGGTPTYYRSVKGSFEAGRLGGVSRVIGDLIEDATAMEARTTILGHVQRGGTPSAVDRILGTRYGVRATQEALAGRFGTMAALRGTAIVSVPIIEGVGSIRRVDPQGEIIAAARATGVSFGD
jgi:6-phosphofructokinase 1